jgi:hypothetical protein
LDRNSNKPNSLDLGGVRLGQSFPPSITLSTDPGIVVTLCSESIEVRVAVESGKGKLMTGLNGTTWFVGLLLLFDWARLAVGCMQGDIPIWKGCLNCHYVELKHHSTGRQLALVTRRSPPFRPVQPF